MLNSYSYRVISLDPGMTTGIATRIDDIYTTLVIQDFEDIVRLLVALDCKVTIYEGFHTARFNDKYSLHTIALTGAIRAIAIEHKSTLIKHSAFDRLPFIEKAKSMVKRGSLIHEVDAI